MNFSKKEKEFAEIIALSIHLKDDFKMHINKILFYSEPLFKELSRRHKKSTDFLKSLSPECLLSLIKGEKLKECFQEPKNKKYVLFGYDGEIILSVGKELKKIKGKYLEVKVNKLKNKNFLGKIACKGRERGVVGVIIGASNFSKFKKNEILVVSNTTPDYVPIMKQAKAIIAEEGGITAHVSIVARELGIPCVVGIKNITRILKDGDLVEVDANKGIVKILKKNE